MLRAALFRRSLERRPVDERPPGHACSRGCAPAAAWPSGLHKTGMMIVGLGPGFHDKSRCARVIFQRMQVRHVSHDKSRRDRPICHEFQVSRPPSPGLTTRPNHRRTEPAEHTGVRPLSRPKSGRAAACGLPQSSGAIPASGLSPPRGPARQRRSTSARAPAQYRRPASNRGLGETAPKPTCLNAIGVR